MTEKTQCSTQRRPSEGTVDKESCTTKVQEGGCTAWFTILGSVLVYYASFGILNSFGFFQDFYTNNFLKNAPASTIAFIGTFQMALMNFLAAVSGALCDRYGVTVSRSVSALMRRS
jgi:MCP family monocarboxylic acid transporter-like MFS transporter 10